MSIEFGALIAGGGFMVALLTYLLNKQRDTKTDTKQNAQIEAQLNYIGKGVDDIRIDLKANERQMVALGERVTRVEESSKQSHKRLDSLEKEMNQNG